MRLKSLVVGAVAVTSLVPASAFADANASVTIYESAYTSGNVYQPGVVSMSANLSLYRERRVGADVTGTTPTPSASEVALTIGGYLSYCDLTDFNPCGSAQIPSQPALGGTMDPLGNTISFSGFVTTTSMGVQQVAFTMKRPGYSSTNVPNGALPNAWTDGTTVHANARADQALSRQNYEATITAFGTPLNAGFGGYNLYVSADTAATS